LHFRPAFLFQLLEGVQQIGDSAANLSDRVNFSTDRVQVGLESSRVTAQRIHLGHRRLFTFRARRCG